MEHKKIKVKGEIVHYWINRVEECQNCIVFSHGVTADHTMFEKQIAYFSGKYTILLWDIPMHGISRPYVGFSYQDTAEILYDIFYKEKIETVFLVGMSMGGYPCQHFATLYPHMVKGFVALDITPLGMTYYSKSDLWWLKQVAPMAKLFSSGALRISMAWLVSKTKYLYQKMISMLKSLSKAEIIEQMKIAYEYFPQENKDVHFEFPVLILVGERDSTGKVKSYCREWSRKTGYPLHYIKNAKHFANGDNPEQVNSEIAFFINSIIGEDENDLSRRRRLP